MFNLTIVTPEQKIYEGTVISLVAPAIDGEIGILTNHHPLVTKLGPGAIRITKEDNSEEYLFTSGGYLEVSNNQVMLLADIAENIDELQAEQAASARKQAQNLLHSSADDLDREKLEKELQIQMVRERFANIAKMRKRKN